MSTDSGDSTCCCGAGRSFLMLAALVAVGGAACYFAFFLPAARNKALALNSQPSGASVFVNGQLAGATPIALTGLHPGVYSIRFEKDGFGTVTRSVNVDQSSNSIQETLTPIAMGRLRVEVQPVGAEVLLDGELAGYTPLVCNNVPLGEHDLLIRKTNFDPYQRRIEMAAGSTLEFKDFTLPDKILKMLRGNIEKEKYRVSNYLDLGHYLFINNQLDESAEVYAQAQQVAATPLDLPATLDYQERLQEMRWRNEDVKRLQEELRKKFSWPGKDVSRFRAVIETMRERIANENVGEWIWVQAQASSLAQDRKWEAAEDLYIKHIAAAGKSNSVNLPQAYIELIATRLRMGKLDPAKESYNQFAKAFGNQPTLARQASNTIYMHATSFQGDQRTQVLNMAHELMQRAIDGNRNGEPELTYLCQFELGNILCLEGKPDDAIPLYQKSILGTRDEGTKDLRSQNLVDALRALKRTTEMREILKHLVKSKLADVSTRAQRDLKELDVAQPQ